MPIIESYECRKVFETIYGDCNVIYSHHEISSFAYSSQTSISFFFVLGSCVMYQYRSHFIKSAGECLP